MVHHLLLLKTCQVYCDEHYPYLYHDGLLILYIPTMHYDFSFKRNVRMEWVLDCILWNYYGLTFSEYIHWDYVIFNWQNNVLTCLKLFIIFQVTTSQSGWKLHLGSSREWVSNHNNIVLMVYSYCEWRNTSTISDTSNASHFLRESVDDLSAFLMQYEYIFVHLFVIIMCMISISLY